MATGHSLEHPATVADPNLGDFMERSDPLPPAVFRQYAEHETPPAGASRVVRAVRLSDTSPPLYYLLLNVWTRCPAARVTSRCGRSRCCVCGGLLPPAVVARPSSGGQRP